MRLMALSPKLGKRNIALHFALRNISFQLKAMYSLLLQIHQCSEVFPHFLGGCEVFQMQV